MAERGLVFVGPSLRAPPPREGIQYAPPARRGDLRRAFEEGASVIGLIDGVLVTELAVTATEIRDTRALGASIFGAASLGALRALECPGAMLGVGEVFLAYRAGALTDDDEVLGTFDEEYRPIARPLVVIRDKLASAVDEGALSVGERDALIEAVRRLPFDERTDGAIAGLAGDLFGTDWKARVRAIMRAPTIDVKQRDAFALIDRVSREIAAKLSGERAR